ncbi:MAG: lysylphosphatidylglycerol synthase transmembrane domain-containing protein [Candidatus Aenigmatarchaeota archaeon]
MGLKFLSFLVGLIILVLIIYFSGITEVTHIILNSNLSFVFLAIVCFSISVFLKSLRWLYFLKSVKIEIPYSHAFYSFNSAMFFGNLVPMKAFEILRGYFLKLKFGTSFSKTVPLVLTERALDVFVYILFSLATLQTIAELIPSHITTLAFIGMLIFFLISISILLILNNKKWMLVFFKIITKLPLIKGFSKNLKNIVRNFSIGFNQIKRSKFLARILLFTFLIWILECFIFLFSSKAVGINLPFSLFALPLISILLGSLTFMPGGLGSIEAILILFLSLLGVPLPQATSAVLIYRAIVHFCENSIGAIVCFHIYGADIFKNLLKGLKNR